MVSFWQSSLLVQALLGFHAQAARTAIDEGVLSTETRHEHSRRNEGTDDLARMLADGSEICGSREIKTLLTSLKSQRTTPWTKIESVGKDFMKKQGKLLKKLNEEIQKLEKKIKDKQAQDVITDLTKEEITDLITQAVSTKDTLHSIAHAKKSECGMHLKVQLPGEEKPTKLNKKCYDNTESKFVELIKKRMKQKNARTTAQDVHDVCKTLLPADDEESSYCDELCESMASSAQLASDEAAGVDVGRKVAELQAELDLKLNEIKTAIDKNGRCKNTLDAVKELQEQVAPLELAIKDTHTAARAARQAYLDAEEELDKMNGQREAQEGVLSKAYEQLQVAGAKLEDEKNKCELAKQAQDDVNEQLQTTIAQFQAAAAVLKTVSESVTAAGTLKTLVSATMESVLQYYDEYLCQPLHNMGLLVDDDKEGISHMEKTLKETNSHKTAKKNVKIAVTELSEYCQKTAKPAFETVKESVDLFPLCDVGESEQAVGGIESTVTTLVGNIKNELTAVLNFDRRNKWHKTPGMTDKTVATFVKKGEPKFLREVAGHVPLVKFAGQYFLKWQAGGEFLKLLDQMSQTLANLEQQERALQQAIADLERKLADMKKKFAAATESLQKATKQHGLSQEAKEKAEALLNSQTDAIETQESNINELKAAADKAHRLWVEAKQAFKEAFVAATQISKSVEQVGEDV